MAKAGKGKRVTVKQKRSRRGRTSQGKGKAWQHVVAKILSIATGCDKKDFHSNHGGVKGEEDVHRSEAARKAFPFWLEVKNQKALSIPNWWAKLKEDRDKEGCSDPGIIVSRLYGTSEALVTLSLPDFLNALYGPLTEEELAEIHQLIKMKKEKKS